MNFLFERRFGFLGYALRRIAQAFPLVLAIIVINFVMVHLAPGDPASYLASQSQATVEFEQQLRRELGLDQPLYVQLYRHILRTVQGDLGTSFRYGESVAGLIAARLPATFLLMGSAFVVASIMGILLGVAAARFANTLGDNAATFVALVGYSMPVFWLGQIFLIVFAVGLDLFPTQGMYSLRAPSEGFGLVLDIAHHLFLPALTYGVYHLTLVFRLTRSKMQETLATDFITTARAKGVPEPTVVFKHALRNALLPVVTVMGVDFGYMIAGSVLAETVFAWPGIGRFMYESILSRDYPVLMGIFTAVSVMVIIANLVTDIVYAIIDPRVVYR